MPSTAACCWLSLEVWDMRQVDQVNVAMSSRRCKADLGPGNLTGRQLQQQSQAASAAAVVAVGYSTEVLSSSTWGEQDRVNPFHDGPQGDAAERSAAGAMAIPASTHPRFVWCRSKLQASKFPVNAQLCAALPDMPARSSKAGLRMLVEVFLQGLDWQVVDYIRSHQSPPAPTTLSSCKQTGQHGSIQQQCGANEAKLGPFPAKLVLRSGKYELCSIQHEGLLKIFDDAEYYTVLQERVDADILAFRMYLQPGRPDGPADASAGLRPGLSINRAGQDFGLQVFPGSVTQVTHGGRIRRHSSNTVYVMIPKLLTCSQLPADYPRSLQLTVVESTGEVIMQQEQAKVFATNSNAHLCARVGPCPAVAAIAERTISSMALTQDGHMTVYLAPQASSGAGSVEVAAAVSTQAELPAGPEQVQGAVSAGTAPVDLTASWPCQQTGQGAAADRQPRSAGRHSTNHSSSSGCSESSSSSADDVPLQQRQAEPDAADASSGTPSSALQPAAGRTSSQIAAPEQQQQGLSSPGTVGSPSAAHQGQQQQQEEDLACVDDSPVPQVSSESAAAPGSATPVVTDQLPFRTPLPQGLPFRRGPPNPPGRKPRRAEAASGNSSTASHFDTQQPHQQQMTQEVQNHQPPSSAQDLSHHDDTSPSIAVPSASWDDSVSVSDRWSGSSSSLAAEQSAALDGHAATAATGGVTETADPPSVSAVLSGRLQLADVSDAFDMECQLQELITKELKGLLPPGEYFGLMGALQRRFQQLRQEAAVDAQQLRKLCCLYVYVQAAVEQGQLSGVLQALQPLLQCNS